MAAAAGADGAAGEPGRLDDAEGWEPWVTQQGDGPKPAARVRQFRKKRDGSLDLSYCNLRGIPPQLILEAGALAEAEAKAGTAAGGSARGVRGGGGGGVRGGGVRGGGGGKAEEADEVRLSLELAANGALTDLPAEVFDDAGFASRLWRLDCSRTALRSLPEGGVLRKLTSLRQLVLAQAPLTHLPEALFELPLEMLRLFGLSGVDNLLPGVWGMTTLTELNLGSCGLEDELDEAVGGLTRLRILRLTQNEGLRSLPDSLGRLRELTELDVSNTISKGPQRSRTMMSSPHYG